MRYTLFYNRLRDRGPDGATEYSQHSDMLERRVAQEFPGFVDTKTFVAEDGERLTIVRFRSQEAQAAWAADAIHRQAQQRGREEYYDEYRLTICEELSSHHWHRARGAASEGATGN